MRVPAFVCVAAAAAGVLVCCESACADEGSDSRARQLIFSAPTQFADSLLFEPFEWAAFELPRVINETIEWLGNPRPEGLDFESPYRTHGGVI
jgi:hypothetical protein